MTTRSRPRCVLLDAGPIIGLHELGFWKQFTERFEVVVAETVCLQEALFHSPDDLSGFHEPIDLEADARQSVIRMESADALELELVSREIGGAVVVHDGELESLAILSARHGDGECVFCAADGAALQAAAIIGFAERCASLEELLDSIGIQKQLERKYTSRFADEHKQKGLEIRLYRT